MKQDLTPIDNFVCSFGTRSLVDFNCSHTQSTNLNKSHVGFTVWDSDEDDDDVKRIDNGDKKKLDESRKEGVWISEGVAKWDDDIKKKTIDNEARELKSIMRQSQCDRVKRPIAVALGVFVAILVFVAFAVGLFYFLTKGNFVKKKLK